MIRIITFLFFFVSCAALSTEIPVANFVKHGDYLNMKLSPDGKHISARVRVEGRIYLVILDTKTMKVVGGISPRSGDEIHSATWINNERFVYQFREAVYYSDSPLATGELFASNIDGSKSDMLYGYRAGESELGSRIAKRKATSATPEIISTLVNDDRQILIVEYPWTINEGTYYDNRQKNSIISRLNIYSGIKRKIETLPFPGAEPFANEDGQVRFVRWRNENFDIEFAYRENDEAQWTSLDNKQVKNHVPIGINKNGEKVYFRGNVGEAEFSTLFELDLKTGSYTQLFSDLKADVQRYTWDEALDKPVIGFTFPDKVAYTYAPGTSKIADLHKQLAGAFSGQQVVITSQSEGLALVHVSSDVNPGEYYLFDTVTNNADFLWANRSWLDPTEMINTQPLKFTTEDGLEINGYITLPTNLAANKKAPMVVMIHGGPHYVRDYWSFDSEVQLFANRGYAVLQINYRGSGGYGEKFEKSGYLQWGGKMIQDIIDGTQYAVKNYAVDKNKMCLYGASYGGYAALMAAVRAPDTYKCTIGYVGIYDLNYAYAYSDTMKAMGGEAYLNKVIGTNKQQLNEYSPVNHVDKIKANVMLIHGERDSRVPVINAETMLQRFKTIGKKVPYLNFSKSGHGVYDEEGRDTLYKGVLEFLDKNIGE
ncbi:prolyl oligopeptidase family serine peptidase [uncultured Paraglaciecola sp.]|jgi:acetyl esterase/lipase|uniref:alpha/beta hydrolase family protein n=1 Tax=uncultured Paraglaciecola sp. TaxID=1765024 RepID=UPI0025DE4CD7|nr:prolyl oligopeptidase family serine peptidase [uncultured Paraglaciecola sp.]